MSDAVRPINLVKVISPGGWRAIGERVKGVSTLDVPIGADGVGSVLAVTGGTLCSAGRIRLSNAFVVSRPPFWLLYVRRNYSGYRRAAGHVFPPCEWSVDYDHALSSNLAAKLGYEYVLLIRLAKRANRSHGPFEQSAVPSLARRDVCFADRRIADKWIGRRPRHMRRTSSIPDYSADAAKAFGFTLKQAGQWGFAVGVEEEGAGPRNVRPVSTR